MAEPQDYNVLGTVKVAYTDVSGNPVAVTAGNALPISGSFSASIAAFAPSGEAALTASTTSSNVAFGSVGPTAVITNNGTATAFLNFGISTVTATTSGYPLNGGQSIAYNIGSNTYAAAITASGSSALAITTGTGLPAIANAGGTGGSGSNASVGTTGAAVPGSATLLGYQNGAGNLIAPTTAAGLPTVSQIADGVNPSLKATVAQFHNGDNQSLGASSYGINTGGVAQLLNAAGNLDRQRAAGSDQVSMIGVASGVATFVQDVQQISTTSVSAAATTATLSIANTTGFKVGGTLNFEPSTTQVPTGRLEASTITAVVANTSVTVQFPTGGALFTHTQPYLVQTFLGNQERDFSGEGQSAQGVGAAMAAEFESNSGGPPLSTGLASGFTLDADRNIQGKNSVQSAITSTTAGNSSIVFSGNPWTSGLASGQSIILSATQTGAAVETVLVSKANTPATGAGPTTINIVNPVVTSGSTYAQFDVYGLNMPATMSVVGVEDATIMLMDFAAADSKKPLSPMTGNATRGADHNIKAVGGTALTGSTLPVSIVPLATPYRNQVKIVTTGTAVQINNTSYVMQNGITVQASPNNAAPTKGTGAVGGVLGASGLTNLIDGTGNGILVQPGATVSEGAGINLNTYYVNGTAGDIFFSDAS